VGFALHTPIEICQIWRRHQQPFYEPRFMGQVWEL
jgi:hypothetical protein